MISAYLGVAGLLDVGYRFYDSAEAATGARVTAGVVDAGGGWYSALVNPASGDASVRWDSTGTPAAVAREYFDAKVDVRKISGDSIAADNLERWFDGTVGFGVLDDVVTIDALDASGGITATITGNLTGSVGSVTGAVGSVAAGGITAASIATGAIDADAIASSAAAEIAAAAGGTGAYPITVTVTDGTDPLTGATIRVSTGINSYDRVTDASGNASFSLDADTYTVSITKSGYDFTPTTRTVTGSQAGTLVNDLEMTATTSTIPAAPSDVSLCRLYGYMETLDGQVAKNVKFQLRLSTPGAIESNKVIVGRTINIRTNDSGNICDPDDSTIEYVELQRNDLMNPNTSVYLVDFPEAGFVNTSLTLNAATKDLASLI